MFRAKVPVRFETSDAPKKPFRERDLTPRTTDPVEFLNVLNDALCSVVCLVRYPLLFTVSFLSRAAWTDYGDARTVTRLESHVRKTGSNFVFGAGKRGFMFVLPYECANVFSFRLLC